VGFSEEWHFISPSWVAKKVCTSLSAAVIASAPDGPSSITEDCDTINASSPPTWLCPELLKTYPTGASSVKYDVRLLIIIIIII